MTRARSGGFVSYGCMRNADVLDLYNRVSWGTTVVGDPLIGEPRRESFLRQASGNRSRTPNLGNAILGLIVLALLFVFLYGPDKLVTTVSPGYMCSQSATEAIKVIRRDAVALLRFGDFYATRATGSNVPAPLLLSVLKMDTTTDRKVGRVTYCTGIVTMGLNPEFEAAAEQAIIDYARKDAKDAARYKFLVEPALAAYRKTKGQLPRQVLKAQYGVQILNNGDWSIEVVSVNPLSHQ